MNSEETDRLTRGSMATIDSIKQATMMDRCCSASDSSGGDNETHPAGVVCLKKLLRTAPPEYLTLSLTPSSAPAAAAYRRKRPGTVSLAEVDAPRDYLSLSITPSDHPKRRGSRDVSGGGGSVVTDASSVPSSGGEERALVVVEAVLPPPVQFPEKRLPPKKRKLAAAGVYQETAATAGTAPASSSRCLALAIVNHHHDGVSRPSRPSGASADVETRSPATMASHSHPIDAVPLQMMCMRPSSGAGKITTNKTVAPPVPAWIRETLALPAEHQIVFIAFKRIQCSDVNKQQSRFMVPRGEIIHRLVPLLTHDESRAANLNEVWGRPKPQTSDEHDGERTRVQGKEHHGLPVSVVVNRAGCRMDAKLTRWNSSGSTVLKFGNSEGFVEESGLRQDDEIEIWAFRYGGLHLVINKTSGETGGGQQIA